ncbi:MAG: DUF1294 domain-containing protein [Thermoplasmatota archaeon]
MGWLRRREREEGRGTVYSWSLAILCLLLTSAIFIFLGIHLFIAYFTSMNLAVFLLFGLDKLMAFANGPRVPERLLFASILLGGGPGAGFGMLVFGHKVRKIHYWIFVATFTVLWLIPFPLIFL